MVLEISFIRSGLTRSAMEGQVLGGLDEPLCGEGIRRLREKAARKGYPEVSRVYTGMYSRCRETAAIIYPGFPALPVKGLEPFDFGVFEGKNRAEITSDPLFARWANSEEIPAFPGGKNPRTLTMSCILNFEDMINDIEHCNVANAALVTHRSVIYMLMNKFLRPGERYFAADIPPGGGVQAECKTETGMLRVKGCF